jgi:hypothetical protein
MQLPFLLTVKRLGCLSPSLVSRVKVLPSYLLPLLLLLLLLFYPWILTAKQPTLQCHFHPPGRLERLL